MSESFDYPEEVIDLADEYIERLRKGESPSIEEYVERYPQFGTQIQRAFPAMALLENVVADAPPSVTGQVRPTKVEMQFPPGSRLDEFEIVREIGRGGMGIVYEACQVTLNRRVAVKVLPPSFAHDSQLSARFRREANVSAQLHHTNIVPVYGTGEAEGTLYYAMQFIDSVGLNQVIKAKADSSASLLDESGSGELSRGKSLARSSSTVQAIAARLADSTINPVQHDNTQHGQHARRVTHDDVTIKLSNPAEKAKPDRKPDSQAPSSPTTSNAPISKSISNTAAETETGNSESSQHGYWSSRERQSYFKSVAIMGREISEALAYAHDSKVLHRDVKPSNILIDRDGRSWLTDFGLAKSQESNDLTRSSDLLGTLRYLPPEAFKGESSPQSDIYGLGLTLYEALADRPAFGAGDRHQLVEQILHSNPTPLRKIAPDIPRDLVTIVECCISKEPQHRYVSADLLRRDLAAFLDDRPILTRQPSKLELAYRWLKRNPSFAALGAVSTALMLIIACFLGWTLIDREIRSNRLNDTLQEALNQSNQLRQEFRTGEDASRVLPQWLALIEKQNSLAGNELADTELVARSLQNEKDYADALDAVELGNQLKFLRLFSHQVDIENSQFNHRELAMKLESFFAKLGWPAESSQASAFAKWINKQPSFLRIAMLDGLDFWLAFPKDEVEREWLFNVTSQVYQDPAKAEVRQLLQTRDRNALIELLDSSEARHFSPAGLSLLAMHLPNNSSTNERAISFLREAQSRYPNEFWLNDRLRSLYTKGSHADQSTALNYSQTCVALRPDNPGVRLNHAALLIEARRFAEAEIHLDEAIALEPRYTTPYMAKVQLRLKQDGPTAALDYVSQLPPDLNYPNSFLITLGLINHVSNDFDSALALYEFAATAMPGRSYCLSDISSTYRAKEQYEDAIRFADKAIELDPTNHLAYETRGTCWYEKAKAASDNSQRELYIEFALSDFRQAMKLEPSSQNKFVNFHSVQLETSNRSQSIQALREFDLAQVNNVNLAIDCYLAFKKANLNRRVEELNRKFQEQSPSEYDQIRYARVQFQNQDYETAAKIFESLDYDAIESPDVRAVVASSFNQTGKKEQALALAKSTLKKDPNQLGCLRIASKILMQNNRFFEAEEFLRRLNQVEPNNETTLYNLGNQLINQQRFEESIPFHDKAIKLNPDYAEAYCNRGQSLLQVGRFDKAIESFERAHELGQQRQNWPFPTKSLIATAKQWQSLDVNLKDWLIEDYPSASIFDKYARGKLCLMKGRPLLAYVLFQSANKANPVFVHNYSMDLRVMLARSAASCHAQSDDGSSTIEWLQERDQEEADSEKLQDLTESKIVEDILAIAENDSSDWFAIVLEQLQADMADRIEFAGEQNHLRATLANWIQTWQRDPTFSVIRDPAQLEQLEDLDRMAFEQFWEGVAETVKQLRTSADVSKN